MFRSSLHDNPHPIRAVSWQGFALSVLLFVIGPVALMVLVSRPALALGVGLGIAILAMTRSITPPGCRTGPQPCPNVRACNGRLHGHAGATFGRYWSGSADDQPPG